jgi:hypothetical protein
VNIRNHVAVAAYPRCGALLRNGQPCRRTVEPGSEFCVHHIQLLETVGADSLRDGRVPKKRALKAPALRVVAEPSPEREAPTMAGPGASADPATVRPSLALAAAENVEALKASLLEAAGSAMKPVWLTVECSGCGERSRVEAPVPDVRARLAAIEVLLREGLGRAPQAEEAPAATLPGNVAAVKEMGWDEMQALFAATYVDEIAAAQRSGGEAALRTKLASLSEAEQRALRLALDELQPV